MTQEEQLLLQDLCARLPYGVIIQADGIGFVHNERLFNINTISEIVNLYYSLDEIKPYLRSMEDMTEEEKKDLLTAVVGNEGSKYFQVLQDGSIDNTDAAIQDLNKLNIHWINFGKATVTSYLDFLNKKMFDYRGLIPKGLAIRVTKDNNPYKD